METEFGLRWGLLLVFLLENVYQIRVFKGSGTSGRLIVQDFFFSCFEVFVQRSYCCYVNTVNTKNTVAS